MWLSDACHSPVEISVIPKVVQIQLLGDFRLTCDGVAVEGINTPRLQSLLAYLALHRDAPQLRQRLAFLFWPDSSEMQARNNLRQFVHALRRTAPDISAFLLIDTHTLQWRRDVELRLDVDEFERAFKTLESQRHAQDPSAACATGERLMALYQTDLLPGCYDEWIIPERERLRDRFARALGWLVALYEAQRDFTPAIHCARELIRSDPLNEEAHRCLMRLLALTGDRIGELRAYQACVSALQNGLGIELSPATEELHQRLLRLDVSGAEADDHLATARIHLRQQPSLAPPPSLIGRQHEWEALQRAWQAASDSGPGFALITGEAGIGKSRLAEEIARWASEQGATIATARSYAAEGQLSFAPVIEWLRSPGLRPHIRALETVWLTELARLLPELLAEIPDLPHYEPLTEYGQRQRFFQALSLAALAAPQPLLLIMDDLQWCDQETLEWLHFLLRFDAHARLLLIGIARAEETPHAHPIHTLLLHLRRAVAVAEVALRPLDAAETAQLAAHLIDRELDVASAMRLFGETEGNPLFITETVRAGLDKLLEQPPRAEPGALRQASAATTLPPGVRAMIVSRLAQLSPPARELAELAATIGREFSLDILAHVSHADEERIVGALNELWQRRIVREHGADAYDFTHDKLREVTYAEISAPQRQLWRRRIAQALEVLRADDLDKVCGQIAAHYEQGGAIGRAIPFYHRAALVAQRVFAYDDAIHLLRHCLTLLEQTAPGATRDTQELRLSLSLAPLYRITRGWTAPELERLVDRILALCDTVGTDDQRAEALYGLQSLLVVQARLERVQLVAEEMQALVERTQGASPPLADMMLAGARLHLGRFTAANDAFERILSAPSDSRQARRIQEALGWNVAVHTRAWRSHALWGLGYAERALQSAREAAQIAEDFREPFNQTLAVTYLAMLCQLCADVATAQTSAEEAFALASEYKAPYYQSWAAILVRYAHARQQPDEARIGALRAAINEFAATGSKLRLSYFLSLLASVYGQAGRPEEGLGAIEAALLHARNTNERWWDAELHRLRGELMLAAGHDQRDAEEAITRAADIAHSQSARSLELRARITRRRLFDADPHAEEASRALSDVYAQLTEGFDTPDAQAARSFLTTR